MPTFERCDESIDVLAKELVNKFESHKPLLSANVKIDFVFAYADQDDDGNLLNDALTKNGVRALGIARKVPLKDRALGRGDAEVSIDGNWWAEASAEEQAALLDHEMHHISVEADKAGNIQFDDLGRPQIKLRKHDVEVGWFKCIAQRHGAASMEQAQAKAIMNGAGQFFWPSIAPRLEIKTGGKSVTVPIGALAKAVAMKV